MVDLIPADGAALVVTQISRELEPPDLRFTVPVEVLKRRPLTGEIRFAPDDLGQTFNASGRGKVPTKGQAQVGRVCQSAFKRDPFLGLIGVE